VCGRGGASWAERCACTAPSGEIDYTASLGPREARAGSATRVRAQHMGTQTTGKLIEPKAPKHEIHRIYAQCEHFGVWSEVHRCPSTQNSRPTPRTVANIELSMRPGWSVIWHGEHGDVSAELSTGCRNGTGGWRTCHRKRARPNIAVNSGSVWPRRKALQRAFSRNPEQCEPT
jgi:hypothetical protein